MPPPAAPARRLGGLLVRFAGPADSQALCARIFWAWLAIRTVVWLAWCLAVLANPPMDLVEWLSWGHSIEWGYPKHPPLPAWLAAAAARLSPGDVWGVYLLGYLTTGACVWAAWRLAREYLPPRQALTAALCLEGCLYLTSDPAEWSNNVALSLGWALVILFGHRAALTGSTRAWAAVGLATGLSLLCKYTVGMLLVPLAAYLVLDPHARRNLRRPGPYLAALIAAVVVAPHVVWLFQNDFITFTYAAERSADRGGWLAHLRNPLRFAGDQSYHVLPMILILAAGLGRRAEPAPSAAPSPAAVSANRYLHAAVLGPVALLLLVSVLTGCVLRQVWGSPLWTFLGVWILVCCRVGSADVSIRTALRRTALVTAALVLGQVVRLEVWPHVSGQGLRQKYPGKQLADEVNRRWGERFGGAVPIVAGEPWAAGNVCCFSPHRPVLYSSGLMGFLDFNHRTTPWTDDADLNARGGVILWDANRDGDDVPGWLKERLPRAEGQPVIVLPYQTRAAAKPARVGVAFVPPAG